MNENLELKSAVDSVAAKTERFTHAVGELEKLVDEKVERAKEVLEKVKQPFEAVHELALKARDTGIQIEEKVVEISSDLVEKAEASFQRLRNEAKKDPVSFGIGAFFGGVFIISMIVVVRELIRAKSVGRDSFTESSSGYDSLSGSISSEGA